MIISAAYMGCDHKIFRCIFQSEVIQPQIFFSFFFQTDGIVLSCRPVIFVAEHSPCTVIKLDISASCIVEIPDDSPVCLCNVLNQFFQIWIYGQSLCSIVFPEEFCKKLGRCGNGLSCNGVLILKLFDKFEMFHKRMLFSADFSCHADRAVSGFFPVEEIAVIQFNVFDSLKSPHKIQMPVASAEFSVCDDRVSGSFLLFDQICNCFIFNGF